MKKIITVLLLITLIVSNLLFGVAAEENINSEEAKFIFEKSFNIMSLVQLGENNSIKNENGNVTIVYKECLTLDSTEGIFFDENSDGKKYVNYHTGNLEQQRFDKVVFSLDGTTISQYSDFMLMISDVFTDDFAKKLLHDYCFRGVSVWDVFREGENGTILMNGKNHHMDIPARNTVYDYGNDFQINGNSAVMNVTVGHHVWNSETHLFSENVDLVPINKDDPNTDYMLLTKTNVTFEVENGEWKVSGGSFFESYFNKPNTIKNPSTSSPTPIYLTLAGAALVGVCLPVVKRKKRRI